jgi:hypothetical protein
MGRNNYTWEEGLRREAACEGGDAGGGARLRTAVSRARSDSSRGCYLLLGNAGGAQSEAFLGLRHTSFACVVVSDAVGNFSAGSSLGW